MTEETKKQNPFNLRVVATALTAVTSAFISSFLTSVINSIVIVGVMSLISAAVVEGYSFVLRRAVSATKKIIYNSKAQEAPLSKETIDTVAEAINKEIKQDKKHRVNNLKTVGLFAVIATVTIIANYFIFGQPEPSQTIINRTEIVEQIIEELPEAEKQLIIDKVQKIIDDEVNPKISELETDVSMLDTDLQSQIDDLNALNDNQQENIDLLQEDNIELNNLILELTERLRALEGEEPTSNTPTPTPTPTPTTNPVPAPTGPPQDPTPTPELSTPTPNPSP